MSPVDIQMRCNQVLIHWNMKSATCNMLILPFSSLWSITHSSSSVTTHESLQNSISHFTFPCLTSQSFNFFFHLPILFLISPTPKLTANVLGMGTLAKTIPTTSDIGLDNVCIQIHGSLDKPNVLVQILTSLSQLECRKIREEYKRIYEEDLVQICQNTEPEVSFLSSLMLNPSERDATFARGALERNVSVDYKALIEIFTCRKSSHVMLMLEAYRLKYRSHMVLDIAAIEPSHPYQKMLMALSASHKAHNDEISQHIAKCDARRLYQTGEGKAGAIDEAVVLEILSKRSIPQIKLTLFTYNHIYGHSYTAFLKSKDLGYFEDEVRVVATCIYNPSKYFAKNLHECLKGTTTNDKGALARIMVSRAEVDMDEIRRIFKKKYGKELKNVICESVADAYYRGFLAALA